jgi:CRP-like cAMP-binding protein
MPHPEVPQNHLLALLPEDELNALLPQLEPVMLDFREIVYDVDVQLEYAYFPQGGVVSLVGVMRDGSAVEVATVGNEGMVGLPLFLGADRVLGQAFSQVAGPALRLRAAAFRTASAGGKLREIMHLYTQALFTQISQSAACNRLHLTEERFARWLLMAHERVGEDEFQLTQDFLSQMLGVRRATVSEIAARAQKQGLVNYSRGRMTVLNRRGLEEATCECYAIIRAEFERLLGKPRTNPLLLQRIELPTLSKDGKSTAGDGNPREARAPHRQRPRS